LARTVCSSPLLRHAGSIVSKTLLVALCAVFAWANYTHWRATGRPSGLATTVLEAWTALLFLVRRPASTLSGTTVAWIAAPIGSFAMLLSRPHDVGLPAGFCEAVQLAGLLFALASLGMLGRSFGLVAANRGIKTQGPYGFVRHPAYTGYLITYLGYVAENLSLRNVALLIVGTTFQLVRIREEERLLTRDDHYAQYRQSVRYRLIPLLY
jgi:protein-S-isoprenylcysteine O-methyltransferase Ste14